MFRGYDLYKNRYLDMYLGRQNQEKDRYEKYITNKHCNPMLSFNWWVPMATIISSNSYNHKLSK